MKVRKLPIRCPTCRRILYDGRVVKNTRCLRRDADSDRFEAKCECRTWVGLPLGDPQA